MHAPPWLFPLPALPRASCPQVGFSGWARMAQVIDKFAVTEVRKPKVGENKPAAVTGEHRPGLRACGSSFCQSLLLGLQTMRAGWLPLSALYAFGCS